MRILASLLVLLGLILPSARGAEGRWKEYRNARFGFVLAYPPALLAGPEPANGGGREFHIKDGEFSVAAFGHFLLADDGDSLEKRWREELKELGTTVTYKKKTADWYVVSGVGKDGTEYYRKTFTKGGNWVAFHITYPHAKNRIYDPWVAQIARTFVPFRAGDFDRVP